MRVAERMVPLEEAPVSTTPVRRRRVPMVTLAILMAFLMVEGGVRMIASRLPVPSGWNQDETAVIVDRLETAAAAEGGADVAFLGSSVTSLGFEPDVLRRMTGLRGFNAGLPGGSVMSVERWSAEFVFPNLRPRVAVIGLTSRDLNFAPGQRMYFERYLDSPARKRALGIESTVERAERAIAARSDLVRLRRYLRKPGTVIKHLRTGRLEKPFIGPHGEPLFPEANEPFQETEGQLHHDVLVDYSMDKTLPALTRLVSDLRARGTKVVLVDMPVVEDIYVPYHARGRADFDSYRSALGRTAEDLGVPLIHPVGRWEADRWFLDSIHLNRAGARRLTGEVTRELQRLGLI